MIVRILAMAIEKAVLDIFYTFSLIAARVTYAYAEIRNFYIA